MNMFEQYQYDMNLLREHFWRLYMSSNSPSKFLLDKEGGSNHHYILHLWLGFINNDSQIKLMFWNVNVKIKMHNFAQIIMYKNAKLISFRF